MNVETDGMLRRVTATREGLLGHRTSSGYTIESLTPFVALPSIHALRKFVLLRNPLTDKSMLALVLDVGPWNVDDDEYVFLGQRPQSESGTDRFGRPTNKAGIDLSEAVWKGLGMQDNGLVEWTFVVPST